MITGSGLSLVALIIILVLGLGLVYVFVKALVLFLPGIIVAGVVWFLTGNLTFTGVSFLIVTVLMIVFRR